MFEQHPIIKLRCPEDGKLWRYMDFPKFAAMLEDRALWFTRPDQLSDPFDSWREMRSIPPKKMNSFAEVSRGRK